MSFFIWGAANRFRYPPGHGDIYNSFYESGLLDKFIDAGKEWAFISNIDNLAATVDFKIMAAAVGL